MVTYMNDLDYADRYVAYLDILGFTDLTRMAHGDTSYRAFLRSTIRSLHDMFPRATEQNNFRFLQFSDSIVLSAKQDRDGLVVLVNSVATLVNQMLDRGTLLRGGIAAGNLHHNDMMMFGPGYLGALAFDKAGSGPHIGLADTVIAGMQKSLWDVSIDFMVCQDPWDLTPMLHTLRQFEEYDATDFRPGTIPLHSWSVRLAMIISERALDMKSAAPVRAKWRWMQDYWNRTVGVRGILPKAEPLDWDRVRGDARAHEQAAVDSFNLRQRERHQEPDQS